MAQRMPVSSEYHLIVKEMETLGESLENEKIERKSEIDRLRLELETIKKSLSEIQPGFEERFNKNYNELLQYFDPETNIKVG